MQLEVILSPTNASEIPEPYLSNERKCVSLLFIASCTIVFHCFVLLDLDCFSMSQTLPFDRSSFVLLQYCYSLVRRMKLRRPRLDVRMHLCWRVLNLALVLKHIDIAAAGQSGNELLQKLLSFAEHTRARMCTVPVAVSS